MILLDFLILNLAAWYGSHRNRLKWSTPLERACYVVGMITLLWIFSICELYDIFKYKSIVFNYQLLPFAAAGFCSNLIYLYIYKSKGRYQRLVESGIKPFNISTKSGIVVSIIFIIVSFLITCGIVMVFTK